MEFKENEETAFFLICACGRTSCRIKVQACKGVGWGCSIKLGDCRNKIPTIIERQRPLVIGRSKISQTVHLCCIVITPRMVKLTPPPQR